MTIQLTRPYAERRLSAPGWTELIELAKKHGWAPMGTRPSAGRFGRWNPGDYSSSFHQRVTEVDARRLGEALLRAAAALRSECYDEDGNLFPPNEKDDDRFGTKDPLAWPTLVAEVGEFALNGAFEIW